jgi:hypothetical protein
MIWPGAKRLRLSSGLAMKSACAVLSGKACPFAESVDFGGSTDCVVVGSSPCSDGVTISRRDDHCVKLEVEIPSPHDDSDSMPDGKDSPWLGCERPC